MANAFFYINNGTSGIDEFSLKSFTFANPSKPTDGAILVFTPNIVLGSRDITVTITSNGEYLIDTGSDVVQFPIGLNTSPVNSFNPTNFNFNFDTAPCNGSPNFIAPAQISQIMGVIGGDSSYQKLFANMNDTQYHNQIGLLQADLDSAVASSNPLGLISKTITALISKQAAAEQTTSSSNLAFGSNTAQNQAYESYLSIAKSGVDQCASTLVPSKQNQATQMGKFDVNLITGLDTTFRSFSNTTNTNTKEAAKKAAGSGVSDKAPSTIAPTVSVNSSISDLETAQARAQADNQIVFVSGVSGVNLFTNPAGDPTNVYTILDIMRDEQSAFLFESTVVTLTDVPQPAPSPVNQCEKVFGKLTPKQLLALIKTINDQIDYNTRILERLQMVLNRLGNSSGLSALWAGVKIPKVTLGGSPGGRGPILDAIEAAAKQGLANLKQAAAQEGQQLLNAGETLYNEAASDVKGIVKFATDTFNDDSAQLIANIKANSKAMTDILASLSDSDKALCSSLNDLAKVANAPQAMKDATAQLKAKSISDLQKIQKHAVEAKLITDSQNTLDGIKNTLANILKSKTGG